MQSVMGNLFILIFGLIIGHGSAEVRETEMFSIAITPKMFNWTYQEFDKQYTFHTSLLNKPDLPSWLHYVYSTRHHLGFIYGTPPYQQKDILLQTVALNREDYETRRLVIPLNILKKENIATYQVQLKIDNLNVEDMLDEHRMERLKDVFRKKLWREEDLYTTFMASAIDLGARLPLRPSEGEGVVLKLGSYKNYSAELLQLQEEVRPLSKMSWCPRDFKRTTVERLFRDAGFNLDWCAFKLVEVPNPATTKPNPINMLRNHGEFSEKMRKDGNFHNSWDEDVKPHIQKWMPPTKNSVPHRSYAHEFTVSIIVPVMAMILLVSVLSLILCFQRQGMEDKKFVEYLHNLFLPCTDYVEEKRRGCSKMRDNSKVQSSIFSSDVTGPHASSSTANLNNYLGDDISNKSGLGISPNNSLAKPRSNPHLDVDYNRPQPPPYLGSNTNSLVLRHRHALDEDLASKKNRARTLEESLQLLNEANIVNRNYSMDNCMLPERMLMDDLLMSPDNAANSVDEDYVPIKQQELLLAKRRTNGIIINNGAVNNNNGSLGKNGNGF